MADHRDGAAPARKDAPHGGGMVDEHAPLLGVVGEEDGIGLEELVDEGLLDPLQVADDPAAVLEGPVIGQAQDLAVLGEVGEEGEGAARQRAAVALAMPRPLAFHRLARLAQVFDDLARDGVAGLEAAPHLGARRQVPPFRDLHDGDGVLRVAAHRHPAVERRALLAAIRLHDGGAEELENAVIGVGGGFPFLFGHVCSAGLGVRASAPL